MRFLTADEVAGVLRCSREHVYRNYRLFAGVKIGRVLRFEEERLYSKARNSDLTERKIPLTLTAREVLSKIPRKGG